MFNKNKFGSCCGDGLINNKSCTSIIAGTNYPTRANAGDSFLNYETGDLFIYDGQDWIKKRKFER